MIAAKLWVLSAVIIGQVLISWVAHLTFQLPVKNYIANLWAFCS